MKIINDKTARTIKLNGTKTKNICSTFNANYVKVKQYNHVATYVDITHHILKR